MRLLDIWLFFTIVAAAAALIFGLPWLAGGFAAAAFLGPVIATVAATGVADVRRDAEAATWNTAPQD